MGAVADRHRGRTGPHGLTVIAIHHCDDTLVTPAPDHIMREGDLIVLVGSLADAERLE